MTVCDLMVATSPATRPGSVTESSVTKPGPVPLPSRNGRRDRAARSSAGPPGRRAGGVRHAQGDGAARAPRAGRAAALTRGAVRAAVARPGPRARARGAAADAVDAAQGGRRGVGRHRRRQRRAASGTAGSSWTCGGSARWRRSRLDADDLAEAVALFRGDLLEGFSLRDSPEFDAWQVAEADALQRELGAALRAARAAGSRRAASSRTAIRYARRWLALDPLHEPAHRELIRLYALDGDRAAALAQYRDCVRTLSQELGVAPVEETAALFEQVSEGRWRRPRPRPRRVPTAPDPPAPGELPLVGREQRARRAVGAHAAARPDGRLAVIEGEAGIGKTRLARELPRARSAGLVLQARCHEDEAGLPYGPIVELLREAARTAALAGRGAGRSGSRTPRCCCPSSRAAGSARSRWRSAARPRRRGCSRRGRRARCACAVGPAWSSSTTSTPPTRRRSTLLAYLGRRLRGRPLLLLLGWRSESVPPGHRLRRGGRRLATAGHDLARPPRRGAGRRAGARGRARRLDARPRETRVRGERGPAAVRGRVPGGARRRAASRGARCATWCRRRA